MIGQFSPPGKFVAVFFPPKCPVIYRQVILTFTAKTCKTFRFLKRRHILSNRVNDLEGRFAVGAISAVLSSPFYVPPAGKERGLLS